MLTHCPICKYDLTGLPDQHRCPECAFAFDRDSDVMVMFKPVHRWQLALYGCMFILGLVMLIWRGSWMVLLLSIIYFLTSLLHHFRDPKRLAIITPTEIQCIKGNAVLHRIPLKFIASAKWNFVNGHVGLLDTNGTELLAFPRGLGWASGERRKLVALINTRLKKKSAYAKSDSIAVAGADQAVDDVPPC